MNDRHASPPGGAPGAGKPLDGRRPAGRMRRLFVAALLVAAGGCISPPVFDPVVADGKAGVPAASRDAAALRRVAREERSGLLHRLARVDPGSEAPLVPGNEAKLLVDGPQTYAAMLKAIAGARRHIHLESYILESRPAFDRLLSDKLAAGVQVSVLYDSVGSIATPAEYFERLRRAGAQLCEFNPINPLRTDPGRRLNNRDHRKLLVVDGLIAFTGGINISRVYTSSSFSRRNRPPSEDEGWRDTHIQVRGPVVADFQRLFMDTWESQGCPSLQEDAADAYPGLVRQGDQAMRLVAADPRVGQSELYVALLLAIANARQRVWLTYGYFVPDQRMLEALAGAARRGVDVRLALPGFSDFWAPFHAGRSHYGELLEAGVRIFERRDALLHAKTATVDSVWASIGSTNLDWRSFVSNYEADLIVLDRGFAGQMERLFELDQGASHEVTREEWRKRGFAPRIKEWLARWWERLL